MESKRIEERNRIWGEIRYKEKCISNVKETIERFRRVINNEWNSNQIIRLKKKITEHQEEIQKLQQNLKDLNIGLLDKDLESQIKHVKDEIERKTNEKIRKRNQERDNKIQLSKNSKQHYDDTRLSDREFRLKKYEIDRTYKYFLRVCDSIPDYMIRKLKNMPNNKGYIWRGIRCFGELPEEPGKPVVLFERKKDILVIHEWTQNEYNIWHKKGKEYKTLYESKPIFR